MYYTVHHKHAASATAYLKLQAVLSQVTRLETAKLFMPYNVNILTHTNFEVYCNCQAK